MYTDILSALLVSLKRTIFRENQFWRSLYFRVLSSPVLQSSQFTSKRERVRSKEKFYFFLKVDKMFVKGGWSHFRRNGFGWDIWTTKSGKILLEMLLLLIDIWWLYYEVWPSGGWSSYHNRNAHNVILLVGIISACAGALWSMLLTSCLYDQCYDDVHVV